MQYVGTNNKRPGPQLGNSIHKLAHHKERQLLKEAADAKIANGLNVLSTEPLPIDQIEWQTIEQLIVARSRGSEGVFIVSDSNQRAVVLKAMVHPAHSFFASEVLKVLGVQVPSQKVLSSKDNLQEYKLLLQSVDWATKHHPANRGLVKSALNKQLIVI